MISARIIVLALAFIAAPIARGDDTVALRTSARVAGEVRLADVAEIAGPNAAALGAIVLSPGVGENGWSRLTLDEVRAAVRAAPGVSSGRTAFSGSACSIRRISTPEEEADQDAPPASPEAQSPAAPGVTVRSLLPGRVAAALGLSPGELRLTFDENDRRLLDISAEGRTIEAWPTGMGDRLPVAVSVYERDAAGNIALAAQGVVRVGVQVRRSAAVVRSELKRGQVISPEDVAAEERWMGPSSRPLSPAEVEGAMVRPLRISPGRVLEIGDVEPPIVVRKGQLVSVRCVAGTFVVRTTARAMDNARVGDVIRFQPLDVRDRRDTRSFEARVEGPGRAFSSASAARGVN